VSAVPETASDQITEQAAFIPDGFSYHVTHAQLGEVLGIGHSMIGKLREEGMPQVRRGVYDLRECVLYSLDKFRSAKPGDKSEQTTRAQLNVAQREKVLLENARTRGELLPVEAVRQLLQQVAVIVSSRLEGLPSRGGDDLADMTTSDEVRAWLRTECRALRTHIATAIRASAPDLVPDLEPGTATKPKRKPAGKKKPAVKKKPAPRDRKSTRLNSSHDQNSYAVFCLKKKK